MKWLRTQLETLSRKLKSSTRDRLWIGAQISLLAVLIQSTPVADFFARLSYDACILLHLSHHEDEVLLVLMDQRSAEGLKQTQNVTWDRSLHAQLLDTLFEAGAKGVLFDIWLDPDNANANSDTKLFDSFSRFNHRVVLAQMHNEKDILPIQEPFSSRFTSGLAVVGVSSDGVCRTFPPSNEFFASQAIRSFTGKHSVDVESKWISYYGANVERGNSDIGIPAISYIDALAPRNRNLFTNRYVCIGEGQRFGSQDLHKTPFPNRIPGVALQATLFLNLLRGDYISAPPIWMECLLLVISGFVLAWYPVRNLLGALGLFLLAATVGSGLFIWGHLLVPWMLIGLVQVPLLLLVSPDRKSREMGASALAEQSPAIGKSSRSDSPEIPNYKLHRIIGKGAFGKVWLAEGETGKLVVVKVISRDAFDSDETFEKEFKGVSKCFEVSDRLPGSVRILHVGRESAAGFYYYVMELGDDHNMGQRLERGKIDSYLPKTLAFEIKRQGTLSPSECVSICGTIASALSQLHQEGLIHRDVKPANIIFVDGKPRLADVGLVTEINQTVSAQTKIGTYGYMPPEGSGNATADIYALGKILYEMVTGRSADSYHEDLPRMTDIDLDSNRTPFFGIIHKACSLLPEDRYQTAAEFRAALEAIGEGLIRADETLRCSELPSERSGTGGSS